MDPDNNQYSSLPTHQTLPRIWRVDSLKLFKEGLKRYYDKIVPAATKGNDAVLVDKDLTISMIRAMAKYIQEGDGDFDLVQTYFDVGTYHFLSDVMHKYWRALDQELQDKKRFSTINGEFEGDEKKVEQVREVLQKELFIQMPRRKILTDSLYIPPKTEPSQEPAQIQYNIGHMIGQNVLSSKDVSMSQTNNISVVQTLQKLSEEIQKSDLDDSQKSLATAQIQTIQTQFLGPEPDKGIIQKAFETLNRITLLIQAPETLQKALNYLQAALTIAHTIHPQIVDKIQLNIA